MSKWFYLLSIFLFLAIAVVCYLSLATRRDERALKKQETVLLIMILFGVLLAASDYFALRWGAWFFYPEQTFDVQIGAEIESYLFGAMLAGLVAVATLVGAARVDRRATLGTHRKTKQNKRRR